MAIREILQIGHPILAEKAKAVPIEHINTPEVQGWIDDMIETMHEAKGAGIAGNQVGLPHRICILEVDENPRYPYKFSIPLTVAINPQITVLSDEVFTSNEGCLSVPHMRANVQRHTEIAVSYYDRNGEHQSHEVRGYSACVWQHECDHLDGILFPHRVTDTQSFCSWSSFKTYKQADYAKHVAALVDKWGA